MGLTEQEGRFTAAMVGAVLGGQPEVFLWLCMAACMAAAEQGLCLTVLTLVEAAEQSESSGQETFANSPQLAQQMNKESNNGIRTT